MSVLKKICAGLLSAVTVLCMCCSCNQSETKVIMTVGNEQVPAGVYIMYLNTAISELETEIAEAEYKGDKWDFKIEDKSAAEWVKDKAIQYTLELIAVEREFKKRGTKFTAEEQSNLDYITDYYWMYYGSFYESMGVSYASFARVQKGASLSQKMLIDQYGKDGTEPVSDEDLKTYMEENYMRVNHILISRYEDPKATTKVELSEEKLKEAKSDAEDLFEQAKNSDNVAFVALIKKYSADYNASSTTESSLDLGMITPEEESGYVEEFEKCASELKPGETGFCESTYGWHIVRRYDMFEDEVVELDDYRDEIVVNMKEDDFNSARDSWVEALRKEMVIVESSFDRYDPTSKKFND